MKLYLMRHGDYVISDPVQPLSEKGISRVHHVGSYFKNNDVVFDEIWSSPKVRAVQTARIISDLFNCYAVRQREDLKPNSSVETVLEDLNKITSNLLIVSHLPFIPNLLMYMNSQEGVHSIPPAGVVVLERAGNQWKILDVIIPELL